MDWKKACNGQSIIWPNICLTFFFWIQRKLLLSLLNLWLGIRNELNFQITYYIPFCILSGVCPCIVVETFLYTLDGEWSYKLFCLWLHIPPYRLRCRRSSWSCYSFLSQKAHIFGLSRRSVQTYRIIRMSDKLLKKIKLSILKRVRYFEKQIFTTYQFISGRLWFYTRLIKRFL